MRGWVNQEMEPPATESYARLHSNQAAANLRRTVLTFLPTHWQELIRLLYKGEAAMCIIALTLASFTGAMLFSLLRLIWEAE